MKLPTFHSDHSQSTYHHLNFSNCSSKFVSKISNTNYCSNFNNNFCRRNGIYYLEEPISGWKSLLKHLRLVGKSSFL